VLPWDIHFVGGVNSVVRALAKQAKINGRKPYLLIQSWSHKTDSYSGQEIPSIRLRMREPGAGFLSIAKYILALPKTIYVLRRIVYTYGIDAINIHYPTAASFTFILMRRLSVFSGNIIISLHGTDIRSALELRGVKKIIWKLLLLGSDHIVVVSESLRQITLQFYANNKTLIIPNGIDFSLADEVKNKTRLPPSRQPYILTVGSFEPIKGHDILLHAFSEIAADYPAIYLVIIGRSGSSKAETEALVTALNLQQRIVLLCDVEYLEVLYYMKHATLFVLPSRYESFSLCTLEAGAMGIPVVATNVGGVREIISNENLGTLVAPEDAKSLSNALAVLLADEDKRVFLGANLYNYVKSRFSWEDAYRRYSDIF
jgi:glycosyltransferase involved in cell wall biosynthesis